MGSRLRAARQARGLTQQSLAEAAETSAAVISKLEHDAYPGPGVDLLKRITGALGVPLEQALGPNGEAFEASRAAGKGAA